MRKSRVKSLWIGSAVISLVCFSSAVVLAEDLPRAQVDFSVEGRTFDGGEKVDMVGDVDPATVSEKIRLETQVYKNDVWQAYDIKRTETNRRGKFSYTHEAFPAGKRYRTRALWSRTVDHAAGRTVWDGFKVERRNFRS